MVGFVDGSYDDPLQVLNSYSTGFVTGLTQVGGLIGFYDEGLYGINTNNFWDINTSGQSLSSGSEIGKTTDQMRSVVTFSSWDIVSTNISLNNGYPYLGWQNNTNTHVWYIYQSPVSNCWTKTSWGWFIPRGCLYKINRGVLMT